MRFRKVNYKSQRLEEVHRSEYISFTLLVGGAQEEEVVQVHHRMMALTAQGCDNRTKDLRENIRDG